MDTYTFKTPEGAEVTVRRGDYPVSSSTRTVFTVAFQLEILRLAGRVEELEKRLAPVSAGLYRFTDPENGISYTVRTIRQEGQERPSTVLETPAGGVVWDSGILSAELLRLAAQRDRLSAELEDVRAHALGPAMPQAEAYAHGVIDEKARQERLRAEDAEVRSMLNARAVRAEAENERLRKRLEEAEGLLRAVREQAGELHQLSPRTRDALRAFLEGK